MLRAARPLAPRHLRRRGLRPCASAATLYRFDDANAAADPAAAAEAAHAAMRERDAALGGVLDALAQAVLSLSEQAAAQDRRTTASLARLEELVRGAASAGESDALRCQLAALELDNSGLRMGATALQSALEESTTLLTAARSADLGAPSAADLEVRAWPPGVRTRGAATTTRRPHSASFRLTSPRIFAGGMPGPGRRAGGPGQRARGGLSAERASDGFGGGCGGVVGAAFAGDCRPTALCGTRTDCTACTGCASPCPCAGGGCAGGGGWRVTSRSGAGPGRGGGDGARGGTAGGGGHGG